MIHPASRQGRLFASAVVAAGVLAPCDHALAAAFQIRDNTAVGLGTAYAGDGSAADTPATVFNNPAGMTQLPGLQVALGGSLIAPSFTFHGTATNAFGQPIQGTTDRDGGEVAFVPHGYVTYHVNDAISVGLALTSPFGLQTYYGPDFVGRYQADKTQLQTIDINPAIAWRVNSWLSLGAGFSADHATAEFASAINLTSATRGAFGLLPDGLFRVRGDDWAFGYNFGVLLTPLPGTKIGLTYRSRLQQDFSGTVTYDVPAPLSLSPAFRDGSATSKLVLPDTAGASLTQRLAPRLTGYVDVDWTNWSQFKDLNVYNGAGGLIASTPERYRNTVFVSTGASYELNDRLTLRGGVAFDKGAVTDTYRTARVPDANRYWLAAGLSYHVLPHATLDFGYAHVFVDDASIDEGSPTGDQLSGHYTNHVDVVSVGTRLAF